MTVRNRTSHLVLSPIASAAISEQCVAGGPVVNSDNRASEANPTTTGLRVLLADDSTTWRDYVRSLLLPEDCQVVEVGDGLQAIEKAAELGPDLVVLDIGMPVLNGIEAAQRIRQVSPGSRIVFLTQNDDREIRSAALATGAQGYVIKANAASEFWPAVAVALRRGDQLARAILA